MVTRPSEGFRRAWLESRPGGKHGPGPSPRTRSRTRWRGVAVTQSSTAEADPPQADPEEEPAALPGQPVTLVEGSTFAVSGRSGDMNPDGPQGLFFRDVRVLSTWRLRLDDRPVQVLTVLAEEPFRASFLGRVPPAVVLDRSPRGAPPLRRGGNARGRPGAQPRRRHRVGPAPAGGRQRLRRSLRGQGEPDPAARRGLDQPGGRHDRLRLPQRQPGPRGAHLGGGWGSAPG